MLQKGTKKLFILLTNSMLVFLFANDLRADTIPFFENIQSSFSLPDFTASTRFFENQTREKKEKIDTEKKESDTLKAIHSGVKQFSRVVGDYIKPTFQTLNGSSRAERRAGADIRSAINRVLSFSFGESVSTGSSLSPEDAMRIRQKGDSGGESAIPFSSDDISGLNVNAPSLFKEQTQFQKNILINTTVCSL